MPTPTPEPTPDYVLLGMVRIDEATLWVATLTLLATIVVAAVDAHLRRNLSARVDFHSRWTHALNNAFSKKTTQQLIGITELRTLTRSRWASTEDKELALFAMEELDRD